MAGEGRGSTGALNPRRELTLQVLVSFQGVALDEETMTTEVLKVSLARIKVEIEAAPCPYSIRRGPRENKSHVRCHFDREDEGRTCDCWKVITYLNLTNEAIRGG